MVSGTLENKRKEENQADCSKSIGKKRNHASVKPANKAEERDNQHWLWKRRLEWQEKRKICRVQTAGVSSARPAG